MLLTLGQVIFTVLMYGVAVVVLGAAIFPGAALWYRAWLATAMWDTAPRLLALSCAAVAGYFVFGISLIVLVGLCRVVFRLNLRAGEYLMFSLGTIKWEIANALHLLVAATFIEFILLTPFSSLLFRLLGAKLGRNVQINSSFCADLSLLEIGDFSVIGGHSTVICHSFEHGKLILRPVKIGRKVVIGLNSVILPGVEIGDGATIAAGAIVPKQTVIAPGSVYYGPRSSGERSSP